MPRTILFAAALAILLAASAQAEPLLVCGADTAAGGADEKPLFRFVQVNDLHVQAAEPAVQSPQLQTYHRANEKARWVVEAINGSTVLPAPDFVVGAGDLIHGEGLDRLAPDLKSLREILAPLRCPFYPVVGNHEVVQRERSPQYLQPCCDAFARNRMDYTFAYGGILFVALNNGGAPSAEAAKPRNQWLREVLSAARGIGPRLSSAEEYQSGRADERRLTIPLSGGKRPTRSVPP